MEQSRSTLQEDVSDLQLTTVDEKTLGMLDIPPEVRIMIFEYVIPHFMNQIHARHQTRSKYFERKELK